MNDPAGEWRSRGYLPHYDAENTVQHIVFCLRDALPTMLAERIAKAPAWERVDAAESVLDTGMGDRLLADARAAAIVQDALLHSDGERYALMSWCVMPSHVHVLVARHEDWTLTKIVQGWKSFTAHAINRALDRTGPVWFREHFDRAMRDEQHLETVRQYIERNPVAAGLCVTPEAWCWSSAGRIT